MEELWLGCEEGSLSNSTTYIWPECDRAVGNKGISLCFYQPHRRGFVGYFFGKSSQLELAVLGFWILN